MPCEVSGTTISNEPGDLMRVDLQKAFVLHTRNFTDSRLLVELFTLDQGRLGAVARSSKKSGRFALLRPFQPLLVSWQGKSDLKSLIHIEGEAPPINVTGNRLYCGMYLNELLLRVTTVSDPHPDLFHTYHRALTSLAQDKAIEPVLRDFELDLLAELGYGIPFDVDAETGQPITPEGFYSFTADSGFSAWIGELPPMMQLGVSKGIFSGATILAVGRREFDVPQVLLAAKFICRRALQPLLGDKPLKSRELFGGT